MSFNSLKFLIFQGNFSLQAWSYFFNFLKTFLIFVFYSFFNFIYLIIFVIVFFLYFLLIYFNLFYYLI